VIRTLDHINIRTADLDGTKRFFMELLGLTEGWRPAFPFPGAWLYSGEQAVVHLVAVETPFPGSRGGALDHAAFAVDDFDAAKARLDAAGVSYRETATPEGRTRQLFFEDPNGVVIELDYRPSRP
jgi:catechol 2,3-dioxygenase-like lactoylglutathione lyase family enzyme